MVKTRIQSKIRGSQRTTATKISTLLNEALTPVVGQCNCTGSMSCLQRKNTTSSEMATFTAGRLSNCRGNQSQSEDELRTCV